uniref:Uncharacterized protein n=1 Tax=Rhizophora mucronata TaxID=61149 RepID=A0A2P2J6F6_RHIMU
MSTWNFPKSIKVVTQSIDLRHGTSSSQIKYGTSSSQIKFRT